MRLLVTGGSGFIGSAVVRRAVALGMSVVNVDKLTYAATTGSTSEVAHSDRYTLEEADIVDAAAMADIFARHQPDRVMHLAAESHVDRSIDGPLDFVMTNVVGTATLLAAASDYFETLVGERREAFRFHHISTDEVFGSLGTTGRFNPETRYDPRSPYSASKAAADHLARAWQHTYGLPVVISNCSNNYGAYQFPEKLIPLVIIRAIAGRTLPVYGRGENIRDWLYVEDHADALLEIVMGGEAGITYLIGGNAEHRNIDVVNDICAILDDIRPAEGGKHHSDAIDFVEDRPGHDFRYAIDASGTTRRLAWTPETSFEEGLRKTVEWYISNEAWWRPLTANSAAIERTGLTKQEGTGA